MSAHVYLELAASRDDLDDVSRWRVKSGMAQRGGASCDFAQRVLTVPLGDSPLDRVVRAHELVHLRLSPVEGMDATAFGVSARALECAEELRVNVTMERLGFDIGVLYDGSEKPSGQRLGENNMWSEAVYFFLALIGTGGEREFLAGIRRSQPTWPKALRALKKEVLALVERTSRDVASATPRDVSQSGFVQLSVPMARVADRVAGARAPIDDESWRQLRRSLAPGGRRAASGRFAELVVSSSLDYVPISGRVGVTSTRFDVVGSRPAHPSRQWRDPQRRIFQRRREHAGGVVLIDQSGSMDIGDGELDTLLRAVPGVTVLGYSHRPGDLTGQPNAWVLATARERVRHAPTGNVGNGVDGPALDWALTWRAPGERLVWVTDGQVTDSNDHPNDVLTGECAELVVRHRIELVRSLSDAAQTLRSTSRSAGRSLDFGRIGRKIGTFSAVS